MKTVQGKIKEAIVRSAKSSAKQSAGVFCRLWLGQEKVPRALLESEVKNR